MSFLGRLNYIGRFIAQSTVIVEPILKLLKKDAPTNWTEECQEAFDKIKRYLSNPPVLVPPRQGSPLLLYLSVSENAFGCMLAQHDEEGKKEHAIYYLSKKFTSCEARYTLVEKTCCALTWIAQKLRHYLSVFTTHLISRMDPLRYIFRQPMPVGKLAKWQMLLSEFDIVYVAQKAIKGQALADLLAESPVDDKLEPLRTFFPDEEVMAMEEEVAEPYSGWRLFFDGAVNYKGSGIGAVLISETGQHYPMAAKLNFRCTNNMAEYEACILGLRMALDMNIQELLRLCGRFKSIDFRHTLRAQNEFADALATIASMIQHPESTHIDPLEITLREEQAHCAHVEAEPDGQPWYADIKAYLEKGEYPPESSANQKKTIRRLANGFFLNKEVLYKRTPDLGLLRIIQEAELNDAEWVRNRYEQLAMIDEKRMVAVFNRTVGTSSTGLLTAKAKSKLSHEAKYQEVTAENGR
ncbi:uncharacterized protein LOC132041990 [Lycium ferocissimum]|uniref:uncharacterized protein LOC132041990 n=1 Tax=Lycium ferocissimum TaxID=112874 RepID=UPI0028159DFF|nr:uncharacterized protein LOC132041990 [Lycium ferocissimum]